MKKKSICLFAVGSFLLYFSAFLFPYLVNSGFGFYVFDFYKRFVLLLVPVVSTAFLLPTAFSAKPRRLFLYAFLLSLPRIGYTFLNDYLQLYDYFGWSGFALLAAFLLSILTALAVGLLLYAAVMFLRAYTFKNEKKLRLQDGYTPFDFTLKVPFFIGVINMGYVLGTLLYEIVSSVIYLSRHFHAYSLSEIVYMSVTFVLIFAFFYPVQWIAVSVSKVGAKNKQALVKE